MKDADGAAFAETLDYVPTGAGVDTLKAAGEGIERLWEVSMPGGGRRSGSLYAPGD